MDWYRLILVNALFVACIGGCLSSAFSETTPPVRPATPSLREVAAGHPLIGTAVMASQLETRAVAELVASQFDCLTAENEFKPSFIEPQPGQFNFARADQILAFAKAHDMKMIGHTLCWQSQTPAWMFKDPDGKPVPRERALANLKRHIDGVVGHFKGQVFGWDVVNEAVSNTPGEYLKATPAQAAIGDDYVVKAFEFAHAADPDAELYYNDYSDEETDKREKTIRLIKELKSRGCRIDAVGIQGHWIIQHPDAPELLEQSIKEFAALGVKVSVTELDFDVLPRKTTGADVADAEAANAQADPYKNGLPKEVADQEAEFYGKIFAVVERHRDVVERVTLWGSYDGMSWLNNWPIRGRTSHPLLWDRQLNPKPAFFAVVRAIQAGG